MICRQKRTHLNPGAAPAQLPAPQLQTQPDPKEEESHQKPWSCPESFKDQKKVLQQYNNFVRMPPAFCDLMEECILHQIKKSVTKFRKPFKVGLKLVITLRHLATGETYTSLHYQWLVGRTTSVNSSLRYTKPSLMNSRMNICAALLALKIGKGGVEFQNQMECPPSSWGTRWETYYNYKGFFPGVASLGGRRIQISVDQCGVKWIFRCTDFQQN